MLDETFVVNSTGHHPMETRSAMAYWQNGKLYLHCSTQSVAQTVPAIARWVGIEPTQQALLVNKSSVHFRADFAPIAEEILVCRAPGPMLADTSDFPWKRLAPGIRLKPRGRAFAPA